MSLRSSGLRLPNFFTSAPHWRRIRNHHAGGMVEARMKSIFVLVALIFTPLAAHAGERVGDAALGAVSGAVVFGPVGLVAGAVVGFTAGPSIAQSWRRNRNHPRHVVRAKRQRVAAKPRAPAPVSA